MKIATGHYINLYEEKGMDIFLILNEPNGEPNWEDMDEIVTAAESVIANNSGAEREKLMKLLEAAIELTDCESIKFGFQILIKGEQENHG